MMYNHLMACCLKANGKVLREFKDTVYVPFGQEYSILLKNLNKKRAVVNITIDGQNVVGAGQVQYDRFSQREVRGDQPQGDVHIERGGQPAIMVQEVMAVADVAQRVDGDVQGVADAVG